MDEADRVDAAIVTTGFLNDDLGRLLGTGEYALVPVLDARAIGIDLDPDWVKKAEAITSAV